MTEIDLINSILSDVSPYVRERYKDRNALNVQSKSHSNDFVTEVDIEVQRRVVDAIGTVFPDDAICGEESGYDKPPDDPDVRCWIIDPIDGTHNFIRGLYPMFGISIGAARGNTILAGGVDLPITHQEFRAVKGKGATLNGVALHAGDVDALENARVEIDFGNAWGRQDTLKYFSPIIDQCAQVRCHCAAVVGLCQIATGGVDGYFHTSINTWDIAAAILIVEEAGGRITCLDGTELDIYHIDKGILATNSRIHDECVKVVNYNR
jgi:myo-inositol-1(or 4)-monophosphatase